MTLVDLMTVIALTCMFSVVLTLIAKRFAKFFGDYLERWLPPRYLKSRGIRKRSPAPASLSAPDEPV